MRYGIVAGFLWIMAVPPQAWAMGDCEDTPRNYESGVSYSPAEKRLAIPGTQDWCEMPEDEAAGGEKRGTVRFVEIRDTAGTVVERLSSERGAQAKRMKDKVGEFTAVPAGKLAATLKARGFVPVPARPVSPAGGCKVRAKWTKTKETVNGFPALTVSAEVTAGPKVAATVELGMAAKQRRSALVLRTLFIPDDRSVIIYASVPQCAGPPPGYFDKDFAGDCYAEDEIVLKTVTTTATPDLATCFAPPTPATPAPPAK